MQVCEGWGGGNVIDGGCVCEGEAMIKEKVD